MVISVCNSASFLWIRSCRQNMSYQHVTKLNMFVFVFQASDRRLQRPHRRGRHLQLRSPQGETKATASSLRLPQHFSCKAYNDVLMPTA
jgi:hypothetical protein